MNVVEELGQRGLVHQLSDPELGRELEAKPVSFYVGFDPSADSLHVGHLIPILIARRFQRAGHRPILLIGGATGMIGDPSGKSEERNLLSAEAVEQNARGIAALLERLLDPRAQPALRIANNAEWLSRLSFLEFLRDVGKHFTVNHMLAKESVRARLEDRESGISYTEFSYMLMQAYDFYHLWREEGCALQIGGSDQWGNITAGCELIRRVAAARGEPAPRVFGLTLPLLTRSDGRKFGKSESGTVWLDPARTSPYEFHQYFLRTPDADVARMLRAFTDLPLEEIAELERAAQSAPEERRAQRALASALTAFVHGEAELASAEQAAASLFGGGAIDAESLRRASAGAPVSRVARARIQQGVPLVELLVETGLAASKSAARREIQGGGVYVNGARAADVDAALGAADLVEGEFILLRKGKRSLHLVRVD